MCVELEVPQHTKWPQITIAFAWYACVHVSCLDIRMAVLRCLESASIWWVVPRRRPSRHDRKASRMKGGPNPVGASLETQQNKGWRTQLFFIGIFFSPVNTAKAITTFHHGVVVAGDWCCVSYCHSSVICHSLKQMLILSYSQYGMIPDHWQVGTSFPLCLDSPELLL